MFMIDLSTPSLYALLGVPPTAPVDEIRKARDRQVKELKTAARTETDPDRKARLGEREQEINAAAEVLVRRERREEYDRDHPDLKLFTPQTAAAPLFTDPGHRARLLHQAIGEHFAARGVPVHPPTDLYRTDFTADETPNQLLDDLLDQIAQRRR